MAMEGETVMLGAPHPGTQLEVLQSPAGFYAGFRENGMPYSRETEYFADRQTAEFIVNSFRKS